MMLKKFVYLVIFFMRVCFDIRDLILKYVIISHKNQKLKKKRGDFLFSINRSNTFFHKIIFKFYQVIFLLTFQL